MPFRLDLELSGGRSSRGSLRFRILLTWRRPLRLGDLERLSRRGVPRNPGLIFPKYGGDEPLQKKQVGEGIKRTEVISDAKRSRSCAKNESSSLVRDIGNNRSQRLAGREERWAWRGRFCCHLLRPAPQLFAPFFFLFKPDDP